MGEKFTDWRKASFSNGSGSCVETAGNGATVAVRDTTDRDRATLVFTVGAWEVFLGQLKS